MKQKINNYLNSLHEKSVWIFTKQETDFDVSVLATKLFEEMPSTETKNVEEYFKDNHERYDIVTDRHRILVIPQLFGLITKTPFYEKGVFYSEEKTTEIYDLIKSNVVSTSKNSSIDFDTLHPKDSSFYNKIKTEQMLKIKIHAIIDTANNNSDYHILPVVFIYKVLKELKTKYNINKISKDHLYTYIMTCKNWDQVNDAVDFIRNDAPATKHVQKYKDLSRLETCIKKNINLFLIDSDSIAINPEFDDYFFNNFMSKYDFEELHEQLMRDVDYSYFLYSHQNFDIDLISAPAGDTVVIDKTPKSVSAYIDDNDNEITYLEKIDNIDERNINDEVGNEAYNIEPVKTDRKQVSRRYRINPLLGKIAIKRAYYSCEINHNHKTFKSQRTKKNYVEAHHLVPVAFQYEVWKKYNINVDCIENLISLCPNCHKAFHYGTDEVKNQMIEQAYNKIVHKYNAIGFKIDIKDIKTFYNIDANKK